MLARAPGTSHNATGLPCQDRVTCRIASDGTLIAVLADGAGSAARGDEGAQLAVETTSEGILQRISTADSDLCSVLVESALEARTRIMQVAERQQLQHREFASTLLALVLGESGGAALRIGDGVIAVREESDENWSWVTWPQRGTFANSTNFLTDDAASERFECEPIRKHVTDVALTSDGLEALALVYSDRVVYSPFFESFARRLRCSDVVGQELGLSAALEKFLASDQVSSRTDDDVSLVVATRCQQLDAH